MLNRELEDTLSAAFKAAKEKRHEFMTVEHLLLALLDNRAATDVLVACGADLERLRQSLVEFIEETTPLLPENVPNIETQPTLGFQRVLQRAVFHVQSSGKSEVTGANVLVAIFSEQESQAVFVLQQRGVERIDAVNFISHGISRVSDHPHESNESAVEGEAKVNGFASACSSRFTVVADVGDGLRMDLDVVPMVERGCDFLGGHRIGNAQIGHRRIGEHHAPAECVVRLVALQHHHPVGGILQLHQQSEIQAGGAAPDAHDIHG